MSLVVEFVEFVVDVVVVVGEDGGGFKIIALEFMLALIEI